MKLITPISFFAVVILFLSCGQSTETVENRESIDLKLLYEVGNEQTIRSVTETRGNPLMSIRNETEATLKVVAVDEKMGYTFETDIVRMKSKTKMGNEVEDYDSQKKEADMSADEQSMHGFLKEILDNKFQISIGEKGKITKAFHYTDGRLAPNDILDMNNIQIIFPNEKVSVGSEWETVTMNGLTGQEITSSYKVKSITSDKVIISVKSKIPALTTVLAANEATGEYELNRASGTLIKGEKKMKLPQGGTAVYSFYSK